MVEPQDWVALGSFLMKVDTQAGPELGLMAVSVVRVGDRNLYVVGGERLGKEFLASLVLPEGMRALLYLNLDPGFQPNNLLDDSGPATQADRFAPFISAQTAESGQQTFDISWTSDQASDETFHTLPLLGRQKELLGILLVGSSQRDNVILDRRIRGLAFGVAAMGLFLGLLFSWWGAARVTRPVRLLAEGAREVSEGNWNARVDVRGPSEIRQLSTAFNRMTRQLNDQRDRLIQAERVAAWRELARRLAHELKNPLFPLQTTVENLQRARDMNSDQFDEVFRESTGILLAEIDNLKTIVGRFSDFSKMPQPELASVNLNDVVRTVVKLFEGQFSAVGRPPINSGAASRRKSAIHSGRLQYAAPRDRESRSERHGRHACGRRAHASHSGAGRRRASRNFRYRHGTDSGRMRAAVHALLHDEAARHRPRPCDRSIGGQRPRRTHFR